MLSLPDAVLGTGSVRGGSWYGMEQQQKIPTGLAVLPASTVLLHMQELGINTVRLPFADFPIVRDADPRMRTDASPVDPGLRDKSPLQVLRFVVQAICSQSAYAGRTMKVLLDDHVTYPGWCCGPSDSNVSWHDGTVSQTAWGDAWKAVADAVADQPCVLGAELRNEPRGTPDWAGWRSAISYGARRIREAGGRTADWYVVADGYSYAGDFTGFRHWTDVPTPAGMPAPPSHLVYGYHAYYFQAFSHGADWGTVQTQCAKDSSGRYAYEDYLTSRVAGLGAPVWLTEFGIQTDQVDFVRPGAVPAYQPQGTGSPGCFFDAVTRLVVDGVGAPAGSLPWFFWPLNGTYPSNVAYYNAGTDTAPVYEHVLTQPPGPPGGVDIHGLLDRSWTGPRRNDVGTTAALDCLRDRLMAQSRRSCPREFP